MLLPVVFEIQTLLLQAMKLESQQKAQKECEEEGDHRRSVCPTIETLQESYPLLLSSSIYVTWTLLGHWVF